MGILASSKSNIIWPKLPKKSSLEFLFLKMLFLFLHLPHPFGKCIGLLWRCLFLKFIAMNQLASVPLQQRKRIKTFKARKTWINNAIMEHCLLNKLINDVFRCTKLPALWELGRIVYVCSLSLTFGERERLFPRLTLNFWLQRYNVTVAGSPSYLIIWYFSIWKIFIITHLASNMENI